MRAGVRARVAFLLVATVALHNHTAVAQSPDLSTPKSTTDLAQRLGVRTLSKGSSGRGEKREALAALPLSRMNRQQRARVDLVLDSVSQFRKLPAIRTEVEPEVYRFFLDHPDVAVSLWRVMKISEFQMWQTGPFNFEADAGDGSEGVADYVYRDATQCVAVCEGVYKNPVLTRPIKARAVVHVRYTFQPAGNSGKQIVTQHINAFISFPSTTVKTVAKVISPVTNMIMDRNCLEITVFLKVMSDSMQTRPQWVRGMAGQMEGVLPQRRTELAGLASRIHKQASSRNIRNYLGSHGENPQRSIPSITGPAGNRIRNASQQTVPPRR